MPMPQNLKPVKLKPLAVQVNGGNKQKIVVTKKNLQL